MSDQHQTTAVEALAEMTPPVLRRADCLLLAAAIRCAEKMQAGDEKGARWAAEVFAMARNSGKGESESLIAAINAVNDAVWKAVT